MLDRKTIQELRGRFGFRPYRYPLGVDYQTRKFRRPLGREEILKVLRESRAV